jgi:hypothetical protein
MDGTEAQPPYLEAARSLASFPKHAALQTLHINKFGEGVEVERAEDSGWGFAGIQVKIEAYSLLCLLF